MSARAWLLFAAGASLAGCSLAPAYRPPSIASPTHYQQFNPTQSCSDADSNGGAAPTDLQSACAWGPAYPSDRLPRSDWWTAFDDPTLDTLQARVEQANPTLASAFDRYQEAHAFELEARSALLPSLQAQTYDNTDHQSANRPLRSATQPDSYHDELLGGALDYEIDLWGRVRNEVAAGRAEAQAASADLESVRLLLHAELARDYIALREQDAQRQLLAQAVAAYQRAVLMTTTRFQGGISSALDVAQAQTQLQTARADLTDVIDRRLLLEHAIAALTGQIASSFVVAPGGLELKLPDVPVALPSTLLQRRPDVARGERDMAAFNAGIGVARAAFYPRVSLSAIAGYQSTQAAGLLGAPDQFWSVGPQVLLTLFDGGLRRAVVARARARFDEAVNDYRGTVLQAFQQVEDALAQNRLLQQELEQQQAARAQAERALMLSLNQYQNGAVDFLQVVTSQITALQAQRTALDLEARELTASVDLVRALGGGWQALWPMSGNPG